ncbi:MAG: MFS transporter [Candidatus Hodarchaeales archaeon]|jgi:MFS family permease
MDIRDFFRDRSLQSILVLYIVTMVQRASFYMCIGIIGSEEYLDLDPLTTGIIATAYPIAELTTVGFWGYLCDKHGRKPILMISILLTMVAACGLATLDVVVGTDEAGFEVLSPLLLFIVIFGAGIGAKVSSTLSMLADTATEETRAQIMGYYDMFTLSGLAGGLLVAILALKADVSPALIFLVAASFIGVCGIVAMVLIIETRKSAIHLSALAMARTVLGDEKIRRLIPVYVPIITLYSMVLLFSEELVHDIEFIDLLILGFSVGPPLLLGIWFWGWLSDKKRVRRPFLALGLFSFAILVILFTLALDVNTNMSDDAIAREIRDRLMTFLPIFPIVGFFAGAFPPAALGYLADVSEDESRGSTMGFYSILFGTGLIIGSLGGGAMIQMFHLTGIVIMVAVCVLVAIVGTYLMPELLQELPDPQSRKFNP